MKNKKIFLILGLIVMLNSCIVSSVVGGAVSLATSIVTLPFKIIGGVFDLMTSEKRDEKIEDYGEDKYEASLSDILKRTKEKESIENFNFSVYKDLYFKKLKADNSSDEVVYQLKDSNSGIEFSFIATYIGDGNRSETEQEAYIKDKINEIEQSDGITKVSSRDLGDIYSREYMITNYNTKENTIERYRMNVYEKDNKLLLTQYLISSDRIFNTEEKIYNGILGSIN